MTKRTRYFIAASSLIMVAALGTGLVAFYNGGLPLAASRAAAAGDLAWVPGDASVVGYANVADIMNSEFRQKLREAVPTGDGRNEFQAETGIDIERDVQSVIVASAVPMGDKGPDRGIALVRGVFNAAQLEASARQHGATVDEYKGIRMVHMNGKTSLAFLEAGLLGVGADDYVKAAIDAKAGANVTTNADMMRLINDLDFNSNAWAVGRTDALTAEQAAQLPAPVANQLAAVQWFSVTGHVNGGVSATLRVEARDDKAGENLRQVVQGAMALARLQMGHDQNLDTVINSLQLTGTGKTMAVSFSVPSSVIDAVAGFAADKVAPHAPNTWHEEK
jgi:hypothetical protein